MLSCFVVKDYCNKHRYSLTNQSTHVGRKATGAGGHDPDIQGKRVDYKKIPLVGMVRSVGESDLLLICRQPWLNSSYNLRPGTIRLQALQ